MQDYSPSEYLPGGDAPLRISISGINLRDQDHRLIIGESEAIFTGAGAHNITFAIEKDHLSTDKFGLLQAELTLTRPRTRWEEFFGKAKKTYTYKFPIRSLSGDLGTFVLYKTQKTANKDEQKTGRYTVTWVSEEKPTADRPSPLKHLNCSEITPPQGWGFVRKSPFLAAESFVEEGLITYRYVRGRPALRRSDVFINDSGGVMLASMNNMMQIMRPNMIQNMEHGIIRSLILNAPIIEKDSKWRRRGAEVGAVRIADEASNTSNICVEFKASPVPSKLAVDELELRRWPIYRKMVVKYDVFLWRLDDELTLGTIETKDGDNRLLWSEDRSVETPANTVEIYAIVTFKDTGEKRFIRPNQSARFVTLLWTRGSLTATLKTNVE